MREAVAVPRVSSDKQAAEDRTSLADQKRAIEQCAVEHGAVVRRWFEDTTSGRSSKRPGFQAMLAYCKANPQPKSAPGLVIFYNVSRFGRFKDRDEFGHHRYVLRHDFGWEITYARGAMKGPGSHLYNAATEEEAARYSENLSDVTKQGKASQARAGNWNTKAPFGYRRRGVTSGHIFQPGQTKLFSERVRLVPDAAEANVVRWVFETYANRPGVSATDIVRELGVRHPTKRKWCVTTVLGMLKKRTYLGEVMLHGGAGCANAHDALVTPELFERVQRRLAENKRAGRGVASDAGLMAGHVFCPYCGSAFHGGGAGKDKQPRYVDGGGYWRAPNRPGNCPGKMATVRRQVLDDVVKDKLAEVLGAPAMWDRIKRAIDERIADRKSGAPAADVEAELKRLATQHANVMAMVAAGGITVDDARETMAKLKTARTDAENRLERVRMDAGNLKALRTWRDRAVEYAVEFPTMVGKLPAAELRARALAWIAHATFDKVDRNLTLRILYTPNHFDTPEGLVLNGCRTATVRDQTHRWAPVARPFGHTSTKYTRDAVVVSVSLLQRPARSVKRDVESMRAAMAAAGWDVP